ncbi:TonB-dependent receptor domain-containing protein [uncultured Sphingomonas sp.]|uniref:TonB-dependent receptor domain-containing protein n=1 Tax=uncultured Sphingomonas sp. TaxID=158754 RepID=UPI0035C982D0
MKKLLRHQLLASSLLISSTLLVQAAAAQTAPQTPGSPTQTQDIAQADGEAVGSDIIVTGSLIRNPNLDSATPVTSIGSEELTLRQTNVAEQILRETPGVAASIGSSTNNGNGGAAFVDLRGLGQNRNIVLLNSTRIVPANLNGAVDLNNIPLALLDRVDILTGGASTTYGADAVSGVVNFITKRDFSGVDLNVSEQITERGDGNIFRADLAIGANFDDGRGNAVLSLGYQEADPVFFGGDRERSNLTIDSFDGSGSGASATAVPARFSVSGIGNANINPATGALVAPSTALFNFNPYNIFQTPFERFNLFSSARYEVSDAVEVYSEGLFSQNTVQTIIAPSGTFSTPLFIPIGNPYLPASARATFCAQNDSNPNLAGIQTLTGAQCAAAAATTDPNDPNYREVLSNVSRRLVEAGGRISSYRTELFNFKTGLRGNITEGVSYDVYGAYGRSTNTQTILNYVFTDRVQQGLRATNTTTCVDPSNGCVPINVFGDAGSITPDQVNFLLVPATSGNRSTLAQVHGLVNAELGRLGASEPVSFAVGSEYRKYTAEVFADLLAQDPGALGGAGGATVPVRGGYDVVEGFAEVVAPLVSDQTFLHSLTVEAGVRYSSYRVDAPGNPKFDAWTYKGGLTWEPIESLKLRGNYQRAVRAPNIGELFTPNAVGLINLRNDPCQGAAPTTNALLRNVCIAQGAAASQIGVIDPPSAGQVNGSFSYSTNNRPETADTYTFGALFVPTFVSNFTLSVDYYNIKVRNALSTPAAGDIIGACFSNLTATSASSLACTSIRRDPLTGGLDGDASTTPGLPQPLTNSGRLATDGIDLVANYRTGITGDVKLGLSMNANYTLHSKFQATPGGLNRECVGYYSINCSLTGSILPKFSFNQRSTLSFGDIDLSLLWRHLSATRQEPFDANLANFGSNGPAFAPFRRIKAAEYFDLTIRASVTENLEVTLTGLNILDKKPPTVGSNIGQTSFNSGNTYPSTYDAIGRRFAASARVRF